MSPPQSTQKTVDNAFDSLLTENDVDEEIRHRHRYGWKLMTDLIVGHQHRLDKFQYRWFENSVIEIWIAVLNSSMFNHLK